MVINNLRTEHEHKGVVKIHVKMCRICVSYVTDQNQTKIGKESLWGALCRRCQVVAVRRVLISPGVAVHTPTAQIRRVARSSRLVTRPEGTPGRAMPRRPDATRPSLLEKGPLSDLDTAPEPSPPGRRRVRRALAAAVALAVLAGGAAVLSLRDDDAEPSDARAKRAAQPVDEDEAQRRARKSGKKVEVATLTDEFSTTYANADGSFTYEASVAPVRAKNAEGAWAPVDTTLKRDDNGWHSVNSPYPVTFSAGDPDRAPARKAAARTSGSTVRAAVFRTGSSRAQQVDDEAESTWTRLLTMTAEGHEIDFEWPGTLPEPVVEDNRALYEGVRPGVDLMLSARDTGFTHVLVVHTPEAAAQLADAPPRYRVTSSSLTFALDPSTDVLMAKDSAGAEIAVSPTPFLWDSAGTHDTDTESAHAGTESADPEAATGTNEDPEAVEGGVAGAVEGAVAADPAAFAQTDAANDTLALPAVNGPGEGSHAATADADFEGGVLTVTPPKNYLTATENLTYPLFVDPSTTGVRANWTTVYKRYPGSSFYDGANYNEDTKEARVGFEKQTWGTARSFFKMKIKSSIKGATVSSATLKVLETHSWSCSKRTVQVWRTDPFGTKTTWNNQPAWKRKITSKSFAYGWKSNSACPNAYVNFTVTSLAQEVANNGWTDFNIGLVASTSSSAPTGSSSSLETDTYSWKKFQAEGGGSPTVAITYNRKPNTPTTLTMSPGSCDTSASPYIKIGKSANISISAKATDPDGVLKELEFELTRTDTGAKTIFHRPTTSGAAISANLSGLANGVTYQWRVRAWDADASSAWAPTSGTLYCRFVYDTDLPDSPAPVVSTDFPGDQDEDGNPEVWSPAVRQLRQLHLRGRRHLRDRHREVRLLHQLHQLRRLRLRERQAGHHGRSHGLLHHSRQVGHRHRGPATLRRPQHPVRQGIRLGRQRLPERPQVLLLRHATLGRRRPRRPERRRQRRLRPHRRRRKPLDRLAVAERRLHRRHARHPRQGDPARERRHRPAHLGDQGRRHGHVLPGHPQRRLRPRRRRHRLGRPHPRGPALPLPRRRLRRHRRQQAHRDTTAVQRPRPVHLLGDQVGGRHHRRRPARAVRGRRNGRRRTVGVQRLQRRDVQRGRQADVLRLGRQGTRLRGHRRLQRRRRGRPDLPDHRRQHLASQGHPRQRRRGHGPQEPGHGRRKPGRRQRLRLRHHDAGGLPLLYGSPDISGDGIPDIVATNSAGALLLYKGGATAIGAATTLRSTGNTTMKQLG